jgi:hypothetical protein
VSPAITQRLPVLASGIRDRSSVSHESFERNGDLRKFVQDLAIDSQQPNSVCMRQRDEFTIFPCSGCDDVPLRVSLDPGASLPECCSK